MRSCTISTAVACLFFFFFNDTATTEIYTLSLHDALPIYLFREHGTRGVGGVHAHTRARGEGAIDLFQRSEEHTSELQSRLHLVCRLLLEKKKKRTNRKLTCMILYMSFRTL